MTTFLLVIVFVFISLVCIFLYLHMLVFLYVMIAGLQCISVVPALSSCKVLVFVVLRKFLIAFYIYKKNQQSKYSQNEKRYFWYVNMHINQTYNIDVYQKVKMCIMPMYKGVLNVDASLRSHLDFLL